MAKVDPLTTISTGFNSTAEINANFTKLVAAFANTLSRDGCTPNFMDAIFDMNSNRIINLTDPVDNQDAATKLYVDSTPSNAASIVSATAAALSETNAAVSETNAATSEANALVSAGAAAAVAIHWLFDSAIAMADPGTADLRLNNATISSVTSIAVSSLTNVTGNPDVSDFIITWDDSTTSANRGTIVIKKASAPSFFAIFNVSGVITDNGTWLEIPVTFIDGSGTLTDSDSLFIQFSRTGDQGASGGGSGDLVAANNLSDVVSASTSLANLVGVGPATSHTFTNKTVDANGTGNVYTNFDIGNMIAASQAEAEAGTNNTKLLTSLRVKQAIDALSPSGGTWTYVQGTVAGDDIEFTGLPSITKEIEIFTTNLGTAGFTGTIGLQLGDSGGFETSGYDTLLSQLEDADSTVTLFSDVDRFKLTNSTQEQIFVNARLSKSRDDDDEWQCNWKCHNNAKNVLTSGIGSKTLSATLSRVRLHKNITTGSFDAGTVYLRHR